MKSKIEKSLSNASSYFIHVSRVIVLSEKKTGKDIRVLLYTCRILKQNLKVSEAKFNILCGEYFCHQR